MNGNLSNEFLNLFVFPSDSFENIRIGCRRRLWAFATMKASHASRNRNSARNNLNIGSPGLFYHAGAFMAPFLIYSLPDPNRVVRDVWDGPFEWPLRIYPLGGLSRRLEIWQFKQLDSVLSGNVCLTGNSSRLKTFVNKFDPWPIFRDDWFTILEHLAPKSVTFSSKRKPRSLVAV
jgi:hypothetical protein